MPAGYLIADVEASTLRWELDAQAMRVAMDRCAALIEAAVMAHGGRVHHWVADEMFAIFEGGGVLACALDIQRAVQSEAFAEVGGLALRLGVHAGPIETGGAPDPVIANRASRIAACAWGGQVIVSADAREAFTLSPGARLEDLGVVRLRGVFAPVRLYGMLSPDLAKSSFPPPRALGLEAVSLPVASGPLVARGADLTAVIEAFTKRGVRHLTIIGPAGNGKTRLVLEVAQTLSEDRGAVFMTLDPALRGENLQAALLRALMLPALVGVGSDKQLIEFLRDKRALIVVDNAEAGTMADAFLDRMLDACPGLIILAAGRAPMAGAYEELYPLTGLRCESGDVDQIRGSPAFEYFSYEMRRIGGGIELDAAATRLFATISARVSGSPLALRLAARWARVMPLEEIAARLATSVDFLSSALQPHEGFDGLRAVFATSWDLLTADAQVLLSRLSIIHASFAYEDASAICGPEIAALTHLELRGLVERSGERLSLHPLVEEYAREKLAADAAEADQCGLRHSRHFLAALPDRLVDVAGSVADTAFADLRAAWTFAIGHHDCSVAWRAAEPLFYTLAAGFKFQEACDFFSARPADPALLVRCMALHANSLVQLGALGEARALAGAVLSRSSETLSVAHAEHALGNVEHIEGNFQAAFDYYERARTRRKSASDVTGLAYSYLSLAALSLANEDAPAARRNLEQAHDILESAEGSALLQTARLIVADLAVLEGDAEKAEAALDEALNTPPTSAQQMCRVLMRHANLLVRRGQYPAARARLNEALSIAETSGDLRGRLMTLLDLGRLDIQADDLRRAKATLLRASREGIRLGAAPLLRQTLLALIDVERASGGDAEADRLGRAIADQHSISATDLKRTIEEVMLADERSKFGLGPRPDAG